MCDLCFSKNISTETLDNSSSLKVLLYFYSHLRAKYLFLLKLQCPNCLLLMVSDKCLLNVLLYRPGYRRIYYFSMSKPYKHVKQRL